MAIFRRCNFFGQTLVFLPLRTGFPIRVDLSVGHFGQNGQKLSENYKISILGAKQWGDRPIFQVVGGSPSPPTRGNPA